MKKEKKEKEKKEKKEKVKKEKKKKQPKPKKGQEAEQAEQAETKKKPKARPKAEGQEGVEEQGEEKKGFLNLSWAMLHILAMGFMLCDHMWATLFPASDWLTCVGRMAYPIFAFLLVAGYFHTSSLPLYLLRVFAGAVFAEVPFNLMYGGSFIYPFHQNVLWTFLIALLLITFLEEFKKRFGAVPALAFSPIPIFLGYFLGYALMTDYYGVGILTVMVFYFLRGRKWYHFAGQLVLLYILNVEMLGSYYYTFPFLGNIFEWYQQGFALFALVPIWLYQGRQGLHGKVFRWFCYAFYPVHMLILFIIRGQMLG